MANAMIWAAPLALAVVLGAFGRGRFTGPLGWAAAALALFALLLLALAEAGGA